MPTRLVAVAAHAVLLLHAVAAFSLGIPSLAAQQRTMVALPRNAHSQRRGALRRGGAALSMAATGDGKKEKKEEEDTFEVTWEHEDGTIDTTTAERLKEAPRAQPPARPLEKAQAWLQGLRSGAKMDKAKLAKLGTSAVLSYAFVSNLSHISCLIASWVIHGRKTGLSPLDAGQWPAFLAVYAAFYAFQTVIRPLRFAMSIAITPFFDRLVNAIQMRAAGVLKRDVNKASAFGMTVFLVNVVGSFAYLFLGLFLATKFAGVPLLRTVATV